MTKISAALLLTAFTALTTAAGSAQDFHGRCTNATIEGDYAFRISGDIYTGAGIVNRDGIALTHFDGQHGLTQVDYVLANGVPVSGPTDANGFHNQESGIYGVNDNCTGWAEIDFPTPPGGSSGAVVKLLLVISDGGRQLNTIVTSITPPNSTVAVPANIHSDAVRVHSDPW